MIRANPDHQSFWNVFADASDEIEHAAGSDEGAFVHEGLDDMLRAAGALVSSLPTVNEGHCATNNEQIVNRMLGGSVRR